VWTECGRAEPVPSAGGFAPWLAAVPGLTRGEGRREARGGRDVPQGARARSAPPPVAHDPPDARVHSTRRLATVTPAKAPWQTHHFGGINALSDATHRDGT
jgi:hypothetical protein